MSVLDHSHRASSRPSYRSPHVLHSRPIRHSPSPLSKSGAARFAAAALANRSNRPDPAPSPAELIKASYKSEAPVVPTTVEGRMQARRARQEALAAQEQRSRTARASELYAHAKAVMGEIDSGLEEIQGALVQLDELEQIDEKTQKTVEGFDLSAVAGMRAIALMKTGMVLRDRESLLKSIKACNKAAELGSEASLTQARSLTEFLVVRLMTELMAQLEEAGFERFDFEFLDRLLECDSLVRVRIRHTQMSGVAHWFLGRVTVRSQVLVRHEVEHFVKNELQKLGSEKLLYPAKQVEALESVLRITQGEHEDQLMSSGVSSSSEGSCEILDESQATTVRRR